MYLVEYWHYNICNSKFVTADLNTAEEYVQKFNRIIKAFKSFHQERYPDKYLSDTNEWFNHIDILELGEAFYYKIEER